MVGVVECTLQLPAQLLAPVLGFLAIIGVASVASTLCLIYLLRKDARHGRYGFNFFLLQNSTADLLFTVVCAPFWILAAKDDKKLANKAFCDVSAAVSSLHLIAPGIFLMQAAAYRHCWLTDKAQVRRTFSSTRSRLVVLFTWALTVLTCVSPTLGWGARPSLNCAPDLVTRAWYTASILFLFLVFPLSSSLYVVMRDVWNLRQSSKKRYAITSSDARQRLAANDEERVDQLMSYKALFLVICIHALFWLPYVSISIAETLSGGKVYFLDDENGIPTAFVALAVALTGAPLKSIVYCSEDPRMRSLLKEYFRKPRREEHGSTEGADTGEVPGEQGQG